MRIFQIYLLILQLPIILVSSNDINCEYSDEGFWTSDLKFVEGYGCKIVGIQLSEKVDNEFIGFHKFNYSDDDVKFITNTDHFDVIPVIDSALCRRFQFLENIQLSSFKAQFNYGWILNCTALKNILLKQNDIFGLAPYFLNTSSKLTHLTMSGNNLPIFPDNFFAFQQEIVELRLTNDEISEMQSGIFDPLTNLSVLNLHSNNLKALDPEWFRNLISLKELVLYNNKFAILPSKVFTSLVNLEQLDVSQNQLTVVNSDSFGTHKNLKKINMNYNKIDAIDEKLFMNNIAILNFGMRGNLCSNASVYGKIDVFKKCFNNYPKDVMMKQKVDVTNAVEPQPPLPEEKLLSQNISGLYWV